MSAQVLGISGSPVPNSNTDRAVKAVLEATGLPHEFIKLSELSMEPCRACLGCLTTNQCVLNDAAVIVADKLRWARAFVIGGYTPYSSLDSRTKIFMERMYCMRHRIGLNRGKIGAAVITTAFDPVKSSLPPAAEIASRQIELWMLEEGMVNVGTLVLLGNVPCIRCGYGDLCELSGVHMLEGPQATVASVGTHRFEDATAMNEKARELGRKIHQAVSAVASKPC
jgi:multimeric flavodoxin WrbA